MARLMHPLTATLKLLAVLAAVLLVAAAPALADEHGDDDGGSDAGLTCEPSSPQPGDELVCTASGLEPGSEATWTARFTDGAEEEGSVTAGFDGAATFLVEVPETPVGGYQVSVEGTAEDGEEYSESTEGVVLPFGGGDDDEGDDNGEDGPGEDEGDGEGGFGDDESQVHPAPQGAVAAGLGGDATNGAAGLAVGLAVLGALAAATGLRREGRRLRGDAG